MAKQVFKRILRPAMAAEHKRHAEIRSKVMQEFPPAEGARQKNARPGIPAQINAARAAQGLTWYAVAKLAGIPNANTVRDIEYGRDAQCASGSQSIGPAP